MNRSVFNKVTFVYLVFSAIWQIAKFLLGETWLNLIGAAVNLLLAYGIWHGWDREQMLGRLLRSKPETNIVNLNPSKKDWEASYEVVYIQALSRYAAKEREARELWMAAPTAISMRDGLMEKYERRQYLTYLLTKRYREVYAARGWNSKYGIVYGGGD